MKAQDFRRLLVELGSLPPPQRNALMAALSSHRSPEGVVALIEGGFAKAPACGHCGSEAFSKWGVGIGMKRYMCNACERTFNALTGTWLAHLQKREKWLEYARAIVDGLSLRKAAKRIGVHLETSFRWRHRFLATTKGAKATAVTGIVEADETFIRKSAKGSKRLVGRAPRKRGGKAKKGLSNEEHDCVLIVRDRSGATTDQVLPDLQAHTFAALAPVVAKDAVLVSDGRDAYGTFAMPRTSCTSRSSPAAASTRTRASPSRTSTPTPAASRAGCDHSRASHPGICRATSVGAAPLNGSVTTSRPSTVFRPVQHEGRTEPSNQGRPSE